MSREVYVFLMQRPRDKEAWPAVYNNPQLADTAFGRCTPVITVNFAAEIPSSTERAELALQLQAFREVMDAATAPENEGLVMACRSLIDLVEAVLNGRVQL